MVLCSDEGNKLKTSVKLIRQIYIFSSFSIDSRELNLATRTTVYEILPIEIYNYKLVVVLSLAQHIFKTTVEPKWGRLLDLPLEIYNYKLVVVLSLAAQHIFKTTVEPRRRRLRDCSRLADFRWQNLVVVLSKFNANFTVFFSFTCENWAKAGSANRGTWPINSWQMSLKTEEWRHEIIKFR